MSDWLSRAGYLLGSVDAVWRRAEFDGIAYNDGDEFEQRMERTLLDAEDKSIFSPVLAASCVDWPSYYHLSPIRANILRPFEERLRNADVLEVGAGCGAITRFLGESGANVCALEGSHRRARIARLRASDLTDVTVVAENFETFNVDRKFDVVTFIGVLEYANQFVQGAHPARVMLEKARSMLKPGGMVLIAIENQLGLKYFAGAPEDHVGRRMFGLENRYSPNGVRTYGRQELTEIVRDAGFSEVEFYAPFPDYKFPVTIFSEEGMTAPGFDAASLLSSSVFSDRQLTRFLSFDLPRVWDVVVRNNLGIDLANSFLVVAGDQTLGKSSALAWHYSSGRTPKYCKSLCFRRGEAGDVRIFSRLLQAPREVSVGDEITIELESDVPYVQGAPLAAEFRALLTSDGWSVKQVAQLIKRYLQIAKELIRKEGVAVSMSSTAQGIPGRFVDLIPQNIIRRDSGDFYLIDKEWTYKGVVSVEWLVFRALSGLFSGLPVAGISATEFPRTRLGFMMAIYDELGFGGSEGQILELGRKEAHLQSLVLGQPVAGDWWGPHESLSPTSDQNNGPLYSLHEIVERYVRLQQETSQQGELRGANQGERLSLNEKREPEEMIHSSQIAAREAEQELSRETINNLDDHIDKLEKTIEESCIMRLLSRLRALRDAILAR